MSDRLSDEPLDTLARRVIAAYEDGAAVEVAKEYLALRQRLAAVEAEWRVEAAAEMEHLKQFCYGGENDGEMPDSEIGLRMAAAKATLDSADTLKAALENRE